MYRTTEESRDHRDDVRDQGEEESVNEGRRDKMQRITWCTGDHGRHRDQEIVEIKNWIDFWDLNPRNRSKVVKIRVL